VARPLTLRGTLLALGVVWVALLLLWGVWAAAEDAVWDPVMPAADVPAALSKEVDAKHTFRCLRLEEDASVSLDDVDYTCEAIGADASGYLVGSDGDRITELQPIP
jgi:hypothetical protein